MPTNPLRGIPSVNELLSHPALESLTEKVHRNVVVSGVRSFLGTLRDTTLEAASDVKLPDPAELAERISRWILSQQQPRLRPVINATGILLHTNLGRAPLAEEALEEVVAVARGYAGLELDLTTGKRSQRIEAVAAQLRELTGAEAALVVNNNAAATLLTLATLAPRREAIVSRGQLIEIGGSYRLPEVMRTGGAVLREVGTTNKTRIDDYADAITEETGLLLRVHPSNFVVVGFTEQPTLVELAALGRKHNLPVVDDIGSGALVDFSQFGLADEPIAGESIKAGADVVLFSGDKLLGGPQCGIIVGRRPLLEAMAAHPLMRAFRVDKMTLAALSATLRLYGSPDTAEAKVPLLAMVCTSVENLQNRAERMAPQLAAVDAVAQAEVIEGTAFLGGGSVPTQQLDTRCVALKPARGSVDAMAAALRTGKLPVVGRIQQDRLLLDLRSVLPSQDIRLVEAVAALDKSTED